MVPIRRVLLFLLAATMIVGGSYFLVLEALYAQRIYLMWVGGALGMVIIGAYLLWEDFVVPFFKRVH
jgi:hypothetical protein